MDDNYSELFVFLLTSDGTFAWVNAENAPNGEPSETLLREQVWNRCDPCEQDQLRAELAKLMLDHEADSFETTIHNVAGERFLVSMNRLPVIQHSNLRLPVGVEGCVTKFSHLRIANGKSWNLFATNSPLIKSPLIST